MAFRLVQADKFSGIKQRLSIVFIVLAVSMAASIGSDSAPIDTRFLRDLSLTRGYMLGRPAAAQPTPDGKAVLFLRSPPRSPVMHLYEFDVATKITRTLLTPEQLLKGAAEQLSPEEKARRERMRQTARGFTGFQLSPDGSLVLLQLSGKLYTFSRRDGAARELPVGKGTLIDPKFSPDGKKVAYVLDADVFVFDLAAAKEIQITSGGTEDVSHGLAEFVAQEEMDRYSGFWWSPDSQWIAYEEADARQVEVWRPADPANPGDEPQRQRYPRPGKNNVQVRLGIVSASVGGETVWVDWDRRRYPYLATVKWPQGGPLTILVQERKQQEESLLAVDAKTGKTSPLLIEKDPAWINLDQSMPHWLSDGSGFLWTSERSGAWQLELRDAQGKLVRVLVPPGAGYEDLVSVDERSRRVYFRASEDPTQAQVFHVLLEGSPPEPVSDGPGRHNVIFAKDHSLYVQTSSGPAIMPRATVGRTDGPAIAELPSVAEEPPFIPKTEWTRIEAAAEFAKTVTEATTGRTRIVRELRLVGFHCSITRPQQFDARKKYAVIVDVYGGPHHQHVIPSMGNRLKAQWLADQGFIVVAIDNRGTPRRGREWERSIYGNFGMIPIDDQAAVLKALAKKYPELDLGRVGITGWSFGGYMAALGVMRRPDVFKAAVAGAPVVDWEDYDTHYTERYLGLPQENKEGYKASSLLTYAPKLERPLLLIHGTRDDNVFFVHSLKLSDALFRAGKDHEILPLRGFTHQIPDPATRARLEEKIVRFFRKHL